VVDLRIAPVAKQIGDAAVRTLGYNGSIAGPASPRPALTPPRRHGDRLFGTIGCRSFRGSGQPAGHRRRADCPARRLHPPQQRSRLTGTRHVVLRSAHPQHRVGPADPPPGATSHARGPTRTGLVRRLRRRPRQLLVSRSLGNGKVGQYRCGASVLLRRSPRPVRHRTRPLHPRPTLTHGQAASGWGVRSTRRRVWALRATTMVEALMRMAPTAGERVNPAQASTPAARGMATTL